MRDQLTEQGYVVIRGFHSPSFIKEVEEENKPLLERQKDFFDTCGVDWTTDVNFRLAYNDKIIALMRDLDFSSPKFTGATFVNKKPFEPARPWHQDWWGWTLEYPDPPQVGILYYMTDTRVENGCLRVLPGSHRRLHSVHKNYYDSKYTKKEYEKEVPIELDVGDVVMIDTRLLHSTHSNNTPVNRMGINVWYVPHFNSMSDGLRRHISYANQDRMLFNGKDLGDFLPVHESPARLTLSKEDYLPHSDKLKRLLF